MAKNGDNTGHPIQAALGPLKPLTWMIAIALLLMVVLVGVLTFKQSGVQKLTTFTPGPAETLSKGLDYNVLEWRDGQKPLGLEYGEFKPMHVVWVTLNDNKRFSDDFILRFPMPMDGADYTRSSEKDSGLRTMTYAATHLGTAARWVPIASRWVGSRDVLIELRTRNQGYYAIGTLSGDGGPSLPLPDQTDPKDGSKVVPTPLAPLRDVRTAIVARPEAGAWVEIPNFVLVASPGLDPVKAGTVVRVTLAGARPEAILRKGQTVYWYLSEEDAELDLPWEVFELIDPKCFEFVVPTDRPASYMVVFRIVDHVSDDPEQVVCEGRIPVTVN